MPCNKPFKAYQSVDGGLTMNPALSKNGMISDYPCGQCYGCKKSNTAQWASRLTHENMEHDQSIFLTLTYEDKHEPEHGSLIKEHPQLFMKRLRDKIKPIKIRNYTAGEYGKGNPLELRKFGRPHYHLIIFGWEPDDKELISTAGGQFLYSSPTIEKLWGKGYCPFGEVTPQSCTYVAQYTQKKVYGKNDAPDHYTVTNPFTGEIIEMQPEFSTMSRKPGIGLSFYEKWKSDFFPSDFFVRKGRKVAVPKYYLTKLEETDPDMAEQVRHNRKMKKKAKSYEYTEDRLRMKEEILEITAKKRQRDGII